MTDQTHEALFQEYFGYRLKHGHLKPNMRDLAAFASLDPWSRVYALSMLERREVLMSHTLESVCFAVTVEKMLTSPDTLNRLPKAASALQSLGISLGGHTGPK